MTATQRKIIKRLLAGQRLTTETSGRIYLWHDEHYRTLHAQTVNEATLYKMKEQGLLKIGGNDHRTRFVPTDEAIKQVLSNFTFPKFVFNQPEDFKNGWLRDNGLAYLIDDPSEIERRRRLGIL